MIIEIIDKKHKRYNNLLHFLEDYYNYLDQHGNTNIEIFYHNRAYGYTCKNTITKDEWSIELYLFERDVRSTTLYGMRSDTLLEILLGRTFKEIVTDPEVKNKIQRLLKLKAFS